MNDKRGMIWNAAGSAMFGVNSFAMLALVSRIGTIEQVGSFSIAFTTSQVLYNIGLFAIPHYQMTDYQRKYSFSSYALARVFSCILMAVCCLGAIVAMGFQGEKRSYTILLTLLMMLNVVGELYQAVFFQNNRLDLSGSALFYRTLWSLCAFAVLLFWRRNLLLSLVGQILANWLLTAYYRIRSLPPFLEKDTDDTASAIRRSGLLLWECFPLGLSFLLMNVLINLPKYGIEFVMDDAAQGYFSMLFMPAQVINLFSQALYRPSLSSYSAHISAGNRRDFLKLLKRHMGLVMGFAAVCSVGAAIAGPPVLGWFFHKDLSDFAAELALIIFMDGLFALCELMYYVAVLFRCQKKVFGIYCAAFPLAVFLVWRMVTLWGLTGAALAFGLTHGIILLAYILLIRNELRKTSRG